MRFRLLRSIFTVRGLAMWRALRILLSPFLPLAFPLLVQLLLAQLGFWRLGLHFPRGGSLGSARGSHCRCGGYRRWRRHRSWRKYRNLPCCWSMACSGCACGSLPRLPVLRCLRLMRASFCFCQLTAEKKSHYFAPSGGLLISGRLVIARPARPLLCAGGLQRRSLNGWSLHSGRLNSRHGNRGFVNPGFCVSGRGNGGCRCQNRARAQRAQGGCANKKAAQHKAVAGNTP